MNKTIACNILDLDEDNFTEEMIKKQYRLKALKYHPDKNKDHDAIQRFQEINEAYEYLCNNNNSKIYINNDYNTLFTDFFINLNESSFIINIVHKILQLCNTDINIYLSSISIFDIIKIKTLLIRYKDILFVNDEIIDIINQFINQKKTNLISYSLNPSVDDLLNANIYNLKIDENTNFLVPLWHSYLEYDDNIIILCNIKNDDNTIYIDEYRNLHVYRDYNINDIFTKGTIEVKITDKKTLKINVNNLYLKNKQNIIFHNQGIPKIHDKDIFSFKDKNDIIIHITLHISQ